jgi:ketosteroid isomerase-like protein
MSRATNRPLPAVLFATALDCEAAFYECLQKGDADTLMDLWADDEEVVCVHPGGPRLVGVQRVAQAWQEILASGALNIRVIDRTVIANLSCAVHHVLEEITVQSEGRLQSATVCATNVYLKTPSGWRMVAHHASPVGEDEEGTSIPDNAPSRALH